LSDSTLRPGKIARVVVIPAKSLDLDEPRHTEIPVEILIGALDGRMRIEDPAEHPGTGPRQFSTRNRRIRPPSRFWFVRRPHGEGIVARQGKRKERDRVITTVSMSRVLMAVEHLPAVGR
jgi:hypothetical protein